MLGYKFLWSEIPNIIKFGLVLWLGAILCFAFMVLSAIIPAMDYSAKELLKVAYLGGTLFIIGVMMVIIGLPKLENRNPPIKKVKE